jgi:F420-non-reducing hydrogenase small subunit
MTKPRLAFYWLASCGGCEAAVLDLAGDLLDVVSAADVVFWPAALDFKRRDLEALADGELLAAFVNGAVRSDEQLEMARLLRAKSKTLVAFGACAHLGGIPGLANFSDRRAIFERVYRAAPSVSNPEGVLPLERVEVPEGRLTLPALHDTVKTLAQAVPVDSIVPGCAPPPDIVLAAVRAVLGGKRPPPGSVLAPDKPLCTGCPRRDSRPDRPAIDGFRRMHLAEVDPRTCFLAAGVVCHGPATRSGCGERCLKAGMPCRGCFGPPPGVRDAGAKLLSVLAALLKPAPGEPGPGRFASLPDPAGLAWMYGLPGSILRRRSGGGDVE